MLAVYADDGGATLDLTVQDAMWLNLQVRFVILYSLTASQRAAAVENAEIGKQLIRVTDVEVVPGGGWTRT